MANKLGPLNQKSILEFKKYFKSHLKKQFSKDKYQAQNLLRKSLFYTLLAPSSYFRSALAIETTRYLKQKPKAIFPWATAIEMVHSGSLIHDDLPSMDNEKMRRGKKCNHLVFGEDLALLAGSCLFIESFSQLNHKSFRKKQPQLLDLFISKVGFSGLMSGQALDLKLKNPNRMEILKMIRLKTASLIEASVEGPLILWAKDSKTKTGLRNFSKYLGMAYQIADDLQDADSLLSKKESIKQLKQFTQKSLDALQSLPQPATALKRMVLLNEKKATSK